MMQEGSADCVDFGPFRLFPSNRKLVCGGQDVHVGGRAMDLLIALASNKGNVLSKGALIAEGWPDIFVHESNLKVTIGALRRTLRQHCPDTEFIVTIVGRGYWLNDDPTPKASVQFDTLHSADKTRLPCLGPVIGRDAQIDELIQTIANNRITSVVGAGGIGKTTVAVAAAQLFEEKYGVTATFIDLSRVASEEFVAASLAAALGVSAEGGDVLQAVTSILARRKALLVFDTCEHVLHAVAHILDVIRDNTTDVWMLATSREVLRVMGGTTIWLQPLAVPPEKHTNSLEDVTRYTAAQLLISRAKEIAGYQPEESDAPAIAAICRRLDGSPLAIELVSTRMNGRRLDVVLNELDDRFRTLRWDRPDVPLRQQTLLSTLEWSYALLTGTEATVLRAISVFAGAFDIQGAAQVLRGLGMELFDTVDAIVGLRAKSMLSVDDAAGELRYRLLDSTRAFATAILESRGEIHSASANHAQLMLETFKRAGELQVTMSAAEWRAKYESQLEDLRKALNWALEPAGNTFLGIKLAAEALPLWNALSLVEVGRRYCEQALAAYANNDFHDNVVKLKLVAALASLDTYLTTNYAKNTQTRSTRTFKVIENPAPILNMALSIG